MLGLSFERIRSARLTNSFAAVFSQFIAACSASSTEAGSLKIEWGLAKTDIAPYAVSGQEVSAGIYVANLLLDLPDGKRLKARALYIREDSFQAQAAGNFYLVADSYQEENGEYAIIPDRLSLRGNGSPDADICRLLYPVDKVANCQPQLLLRDTWTDHHVTRLYSLGVWSSAAPVQGTMDATSQPLLLDTALLRVAFS